MMILTPYLSFNGNCTEAMAFYQSCLGGELHVTKVGDSQMASQMPDKKDQVMHAMLKSNAIVLMASDLIMGGTTKQGNTVTLTLSGGTKEELQGYFNKLKEGGNVTHALKDEFFGTYGDLTDKYGFNWAFQAEPEK